MNKVKINEGVLRFTRNLSLIAAAGCLATGSLIFHSNIVIETEPMIHSICGVTLDLCAIFPAGIAYHNHQLLKKRK